MATIPAAPRLRLSGAPGSMLLEVYLRDHLAGASLGLRAARRALRHAEGCSYEGDLRVVVTQIRDDRRVLIRVADHLGVPRPRAKEALAQVAERAGAMKLNGQIVGTSPLSQLVEIEGLLLGVRGKLQLWRALDAALAAGELPDDVDAREMAQRASDQLERLTDAHATAARRAFGGAVR